MSRTHTTSLAEWEPACGRPSIATGDIPFPRGGDAEASADHERSVWLAERRWAWELVRSTQRGEADAFAVLYQRYRGRVLGYLVMRVKDPVLAEDLTSETFLRALLNIHSVRDLGRDVSAWLTTIARNVANDVFRSARRRAEVLTGAFSAEDLPVSGHEEDVLTRLECERVREYLQYLTDDQRECIELRFMKQLNTVEAARRMNRRENALRALQARAVRRLAGMYADGVAVEKGAAA